MAYSSPPPPDAPDLLDTNASIGTALVTCTAGAPSLSRCPVSLCAIGIANKEVEHSDSNSIPIVKVYIGQQVIEMLIRRPQPEEHDSVRAVVQTVVDEIYGDLWAPPPLPVDEENWHSFWVAVRDAKIIGVVRTTEEWLDDLWVLGESRGYGVGQRLLAQGEAEIIARGYETLRLRVVQSNAAAIEFYGRHGWRIARVFPHERYPITMLEMFKLSKQDER